MRASPVPQQSNEEDITMRFRERDGTIYMVRTAYSSEARRGKETGLGYIPAWATPNDIDDTLRLREGVTLTEAERLQLVEHLAHTNPPDSLKRAAVWLQRGIEHLSGLPLRDRQAKIRQVRPLWHQLSALAGTKSSPRPEDTSAPK